MKRFAKTVNGYFRKRFHLTCLTGFWIRLRNSTNNPKMKNLKSLFPNHRTFFPAVNRKIGTSLSEGISKHHVWMNFRIVSNAMSQIQRYEKNKYKCQQRKRNLSTTAASFLDYVINSFKPNVPLIYLLKTSEKL